MYISHLWGVLDIIYKCVRVNGSQIFFHRGRKNIGKKNMKDPWGNCSFLSVIFTNNLRPITRQLANYDNNSSSPAPCPYDLRLPITKVEQNLSPVAKYIDSTEHITVQKASWPGALSALCMFLSRSGVYRKWDILTIRVHPHGVWHYAVFRVFCQNPFWPVYLQVTLWVYSAPGHGLIRSGGFLECDMHWIINVCENTRERNYWVSGCPGHPKTLPETQFFYKGFRPDTL